MFLGANKKDCEVSKRAVTPEIFFPNEADQEHYLNVASTYKRWRSASPSPSPASTSISSESLVLGSPLFMGNSVDSKTDSSLSTTTDEGCDDDPLATKVKSSIENIDKLCNVSGSRHKRHRRTSSQTRNSLIEDHHDDSGSPLYPGRKRSADEDDVLEELQNKEESSALSKANAPQILEDIPCKQGITSNKGQLGKGVIASDKGQLGKGVIAPDKGQITSGLIVLKLDNSKAASLSRSCKWGGHFRKVII
ncbi:UNVERIFIED_CONTAM: hypothetical protein RMT77_007986 [Armadillidium vulgare]